MKTPTQIGTDITRRLAATWYTDSVGASFSWPHTFPLGSLATAELAGDFAGVQKQCRVWDDWSSREQVPLTYANRRIHGTTQQIPTHATVASVDHAARLSGPEWVERVNRARQRADALTSRFPVTGSEPAILRSVDGYSDVDFSLLLDAADWFSTHDAAGLTPRQVPISGLHAKWLNTHQPQILALTGKNSLGLLPPHPSRLHVTYLDPQWRAAGGRWHDCATVGDAYVPAYMPLTVIISENKDTAVHFPELTQGIAVEGSGRGGGTAASFPWLATAPRLFYWGDIDAHGFEILDGFRQAGVPVTSMLMDASTFAAHAQFASSTDVGGRPLEPIARRPLVHLTDDERTVYEMLTDPSWNGPRRVEQERISLELALATVSELPPTR